MKKYLVVMLAVLLVGMSSYSFAGDAGGIALSVHDLSAYDTATGQICVFCHTPHDGGRNLAANGVLWNHTLTSATFVPYASVSIDGVPADVAGQPVGTAKMCLSCHDGSVALDAFSGGAGTPARVISTGKVPNLNGTNFDLRGTHPISISYNEVDPQLKPIAAVSLGNGTGNIALANLLEGGTLIQCMTCHDVHNTNESVAGTPFLRNSLTASELCIKCHNK